jgi:hypothetical protein
MYVQPGYVCRLCFLRVIFFTRLSFHLSLNDCSRALLIILWLIKLQDLSSFLENGNLNENLASIFLKRLPLFLSAYLSVFG